MFNFWWLAGLVNGLKTRPPPLSSQKIKCSFLDYVHFLMIAGLVGELEPHLPPISSQKNKMLIFGLHLTSDDWPGRSMDSNPVHHPSPVQKKLNAWLQPHLPPCLAKKKMLIFGLHWTSDDRLGWLMDLNPLCHPSPVKKIKCSFFDYVQLLMIGQAVQWTRTPSATPLQPQK